MAKQLSISSVHKKKKLSISSVSATNNNNKYNNNVYGFFIVNLVELFQT